MMVGLRWPRDVWLLIGRVGSPLKNHSHTYTSEATKPPEVTSQKQQGERKRLRGSVSSRRQIHLALKLAASLFIYLTG